jgi:hypothetical protein
MSLSVVGQKVELRSEVQIAASAALVWEVLTNLRAYPEWNPLIVQAEGQLSEGAVVAITINLPGNRERNRRCRVVKLASMSELRWASTLLLRTLSYSEQYFQLHPLEGHQVRLAVGENFSGILAPRNQAQLAQISQGLALMNQAIKRRAEALQIQSR